MNNKIRYYINITDRQLQFIKKVLNEKERKHTFCSILMLFLNNLFLDVIEDCLKCSKISDSKNIM